MNTLSSRFALVAILVGALCIPVASARAAANGQDFLFVDAPREISRAAVSIESGFEERGITRSSGSVAVHRLGVRWPLENQWDAMTRVGIATGSDRTRSDIELKASWTAGRGHVRGSLLSIRAGGRRESSGTTVLLAGVAASRPLAGSLVAASVDVERAMDAERDELDILTSAGWLVPLGAQFAAGFEMSGQDLEGFWSESEAEGGAVLFAGPTVAMHGLRSPWSLAVAGGPVFHATHSTRTANPLRPLRAGRDGYALRLSLHLGEDR